METVNRRAFLKRAAQAAPFAAVGVLAANQAQATVGGAQPLLTLSTQEKVLVGLSRAKALVNPNGSKAEIEAGLTQAFHAIPGFTRVYYECVQVDGIWWDLIGGITSGRAWWHGPLEVVTALGAR